MVQTSSPELRETDAGSEPPSAPSTPEYSSWISRDRSTDAASVTMRREAAELVERVLTHYRDSTTHEADGQWTEPVAHYLDADRWRRETDAVHRSVPLPLAMSCELPGPNTYKAIDVLGLPVLITRDRQGAVHAMINACRHRGAKLVEPGCGVSRRLTCPYHSWSYDLAGELRGVYAEKTFGEVPREGRGLIRLPAGERAGIVFVSLDPAAEPDLDDWLGDLLPLLEGLRLAECHHYSTGELSSPNWKVTLDGYLETYHFASLHPKTVFETNLSNMMAHDTWGPHQRIAPALRPIAQAVELPPDRRDPGECVGPIYWLFPGLAIAGGWRQKIAVSLVLPRTAIESVTQQIILLREPAVTEEEREAADRFGAWFHEVVRDEDYATTYGVQQGLAALDGTDFVFGRNEPGLQHFHRTIHQHLDRQAEGTQADRATR
ncbi:MULTISPECIES: aromatic ring-hydroxylating oxygenase subunit alpha [Streptomyces]|uniref:Aromatic ring-hydroxylating dioxygenase subunit alpha n=1 Tax=Streptomyces caniscabiei TaxID=2746961 RepID=A0ABU4MUV9_9ACTN|nr:MULTISPECIES: aromatic ring-hydroxylating dioxygenase subunit alpha [Streptomyces]MBE4733369.1 aromatic ring-hydroxylating dioxygenase subunit alpha [Streptomyces caniscabiei]MBE4754547.1 aromatic ring-hydroxylating dioxygenase subunit alpha [Streptomyces caniscabiei]MBE4768632.1 aromatic ring-hydroxylating dioxygenase subunit alpha [Streptomyces caniscabiei]MBE4781864.1 aromatic ring-hydroxylating dioxygenase subunit alpha [Streptomyces caniscabiei]MBE4793154.1 aromatic ring-hydroxylating 